MPKKLTVAVIAAAALAVGGTAIAQTAQRFRMCPQTIPPMRLSSGLLRSG